MRMRSTYEAGEGRDAITCRAHARAELGMDSGDADLLVRSLGGSFPMRRE